MRPLKSRLALLFLNNICHWLVRRIHFVIRRNSARTVTLPVIGRYRCITTSRFQVQTKVSFNRRCSDTAETLSM